MWISAGRRIRFAKAMTFLVPSTLVRIADSSGGLNVDPARRVDEHVDVLGDPLGHLLGHPQVGLGDVAVDDDHLLAQERRQLGLVEALPPDGVAVVPHAEPLLERHVAQLDCAVVTFGAELGADVRLASFTAAGGAGQAEIELRGRTLTVPVNFTARHNAINMAAAVAAYDALGLQLDDISAGSRDVVFSRWRGEEIELPGGGLLIADCYNANPTSMRAALAHLTDLAGTRRRVAVLGDMAELGDAAPGYHREIGALLDQLEVEVVLAVGEQAKLYGGHWFATAAEAGDALAGLVQPGDAVLVKASRSVGLERAVEAIAP